MKKLLLVLIACMITGYVVAAHSDDDLSGSDSSEAYESDTLSGDLTPSPTDESISMSASPSTLTASDSVVTTPHHTTDHTTPLYPSLEPDSHVPAVHDEDIETNHDNLPLGGLTSFQSNLPFYHIIGVSTAAALVGAGTAALYNKVGKKKVNKAKVAAALWVGTAVAMTCYYYGPILCPCLFGGVEE